MTPHEVTKQELEDFLAEYCDCWCMDDEEDRARLAKLLIATFKLEAKGSEKT